MSGSQSGLGLRQVLLSATTIFVGTAAVGLTAELARQHLSAEPAPKPEHDHSDWHQHQQDQEHKDDQGFGHRRPPAYARHGHRLLSVRHDDGPFGYFLNSLGGVVTAWEARRLARRHGAASAGGGVAAATLAVAAHALAHVVSERGEGRAHVVATITSPCHRRLLAMSLTGAGLGTGLARLSRQGPLVLARHVTGDPAH